MTMNYFEIGSVTATAIDSEIISESNDQISLLLSHEKLDDSVKIDIFVDGDHFCAILTDLAYDDNAFDLIDARVCDPSKGFKLSYVNKNGRISFLTDGSENLSSAASPLISFIFKIKDGIYGDFIFSLEPTVEKSACGIVDGYVNAFSVIGDSLSVSLFPDNRKCSVESLRIIKADNDLMLYAAVRGDVGFSITFETLLFSIDGEDKNKLFISRAISPAMAEQAINKGIEIYARIPQSTENIFYITVRAIIHYKDYNVSSEIIRMTFTDKTTISE